MSIGSRLRQLRLAKKLSQEKFGELLGGVTKGMVSQWESDHGHPPTDRLLELHKHLNFSFDWLLEGDDEAPLYATADHTIGQIIKALEPRPEYLKENALKTVLNTIYMVERAQHVEPDKASEDPPDPEHEKVSVNVSKRRLAKAGKAELSFARGRKKNVS